MLHLGHAARARGDVEGGVRKLEAARSEFKQQGDLPGTAWACLFAAEALRERDSRGDAEKEGELIREGESLADSIDIPPLLERFKELESKLPAASEQSSRESAP